MSVPKAFRDSVGKTCIRVSLQTGDRREAAKRARPHIDHWHSEFDRLRGFAPEKVERLNAALADIGFTVDLESKADVALVTEKFAGAYMLDAVREAVVDHARKYEQLSAVIPDDVDALMASDKYRDAFVEKLSTAAAKVRPVAHVGQQVMGKEPSATKPVGKTLDALLAAWERERKPAERTLHEYRYTVRRFNEWFGLMLVKDITKAHVSEFRGVLMDIPARVPNADTRLPIKELLAKYDGTDCLRSSPLAASRRLDALKTLMNLGIQSGWIDANPCAFVKITEDGDTKRRAFSLDETRKALKALGGQGDSLAWIVRLGIYTGMRLGEICQLRRVDVRHEDGVHFISVNAEAGKRVKTAESVREVPIHPDIRDEFLAFVAGRGDGPLFADIPAHKNRTVAERVTKMFAAWLAENDLTADGLCFHSWRHAFKDRCRAAGLSEEHHDSLTGHAGRTVGRRYGGRPPLAVLAEAVAKLQFPVDLAHLKP